MSAAAEEAQFAEDLAAAKRLSLQSHEQEQQRRQQTRPIQGTTRTTTTTQDNLWEGGGGGGTSSQFLLQVGKRGWSIPFDDSWCYHLSIPDVHPGWVS